MIKTLKLKDFTVFSPVRLDFSPGLNVLIGENATGKSHLLKLCYALQSALRSPSGEASVKDRISFVFSCESEDILRNKITKAHAGIELVTANGSYAKCPGGNTPKDTSMHVDDFENGEISCVYIPSGEILSFYRGFRATLKNREPAFDGTYPDLAEALDMPSFKGERLEEVRPLFEPLENILRASVVQENGEFFFAQCGTKGSDRQVMIPARLAAEGHRTLGQVACLLKNGTLREGATLFWDESEAGLNPKLQVHLAGILTELGRVMQIVITTHSLFLLRELEILQEEHKLDNPHYIALHFNEDGLVDAVQGDTSNDIGDIASLEANLDQSDRYMDLDYAGE